MPVATLQVALVALIAVAAIGGELDRLALPHWTIGKVATAAGEGEILSGTFSPTLGKAIALARVPAGEVGAVEVDIRGKRLPVRVVKYPFVRDGAAQPGVLD